MHQLQPSHPQPPPQATADQSRIHMAQSQAPTLFPFQNYPVQQPAAGLNLLSMQQAINSLQFQDHPPSLPTANVSQQQPQGRFDAAATSSLLAMLQRAQQQQQQQNDASRSNVFTSQHTNAPHLPPQPQPQPQPPHAPLTPPPGFSSPLIRQHPPPPPPLQGHSTLASPLPTSSNVPPGFHQSSPPPSASSNRNLNKAGGGGGGKSHARLVPRMPLDLLDRDLTALSASLAPSPEERERHRVALEAVSFPLNNRPFIGLNRSDPRFPFFSGASGAAG